MKRLLCLVLCCGILTIGGCAGFSAETSDQDAPTRSAQSTTPSTPQSDITTTTPNSPPPEITTTDASLGAAVQIESRRNSLVRSNVVFNGWNISIRITAMGQADAIHYVVSNVNVVEGDATREVTIGSEVGATIPPHDLDLLQRGDTITVYAISENEREELATISIKSSYGGPYEGPDGWANEWRGSTPDIEDFTTATPEVS